jgi:hypothetical protein
MGMKLVLSARSEGGAVQDFDGRGPRIVELLEPSNDRGAGPWLVSVAPPIPDREGALHDRAVVFPRYEGASLGDVQEGSWMPVSVGVGSRGTAGQGAEYMWVSGELARSVLDLPPTAGQHFERRWNGYQRWLEATGEPNPDADVVFEGERVGSFIATVKQRKLEGLLASDLVERFESIEGWKWWECDSIELLARYAEREGHCQVPARQIEEGRPLGAASRFLAQIYRLAKNLAENASGMRGRDRSFAELLGNGDLDRLESIPGWQRFVDRVSKEQSAAWGQLAQAIEDAKPGGTGDQRHSGQ